jgi:hypothetical protein
VLGFARFLFEGKDALPMLEKQSIGELFRDVRCYEVQFGFVFIFPEPYVAQHLVWTRVAVAWSSRVRLSPLSYFYAESFKKPKITLPIMRID